MSVEVSITIKCDNCGESLCGEKSPCDDSLSADNWFREAGWFTGSNEDLCPPCFAAQVMRDSRQMEGRG